MPAQVAYRMAARWRRENYFKCAREHFALNALDSCADTLHVRFDPPSAPRRSKALGALCAELTDTATRYPGTDLTRLFA